MTDEKVIIVTGASQGLGAAVTHCLFGLGAIVVLVARSKENMENQVSSLPPNLNRALVVPTDITDPEACRHVVDVTMAQYGRIDGLVNNAGVVGPVATIENADLEQWRHNLSVNLFGAFYLIHYTLPALKARRGRIVNVSSGAAHHAIAAASAYCVAKAALNHLNQVLSVETPQVTAVAIRPGVVDTPMQSQIRREGPGAMPADQVDYYQALKRRGQLEPPSVPARAIAWLALHAPESWSGRFVNYDDQEIVTALTEHGHTPLTESGGDKAND